MTVAGAASDSSRVEPQAVVVPLTRAAIFLVATINAGRREPGDGQIVVRRSFGVGPCGGLPGAARQFVVHNGDWFGRVG